MVFRGYSSPGKKFLKVVVVGLLMFIWIFCLIYFFLPFICSQTSFLKKRIERAAELYLKADVKINDFKWQGFPHLNLRGVRIRPSVQIQGVEEIYLSKISFVLPPKGFFKESLLLSLKNIFFTQTFFKCAYIDGDSWSLSNGAFWVDWYALDFLYFFRGERQHALGKIYHFIERINLGEKVLSKLKGQLIHKMDDIVEGNGTFFWDNTPFVYRVKGSSRTLNLSLEGVGLGIEKVLPEKIKATGNFEIEVLLKIKDNKVGSFSGVLESKEVGYIYKVDLYHLLSGLPEIKQKGLRYVLDNFSNYQYKYAKIFFEWKEPVFLLDFTLEGTQPGNDRHITIPIELDQGVLSFLKQLLRT